METSFRVKSDGLELAVEVFGQGPPLLFGHGLTGNRHFSRAQLTPLADRYRVIIFDQRGHCDSTPITEPGRYNPEAMAADIGAVLNALGVERAVVGGESMGAATALVFALRWPERVEKLLLTAPAFGHRPNPARENIREMGRAIAALGIDAYLAQSAERQRTEWGLPQQIIDFLAQMHRSHDPASLATACQTVIDWVILPDLSSLAELACPVCVIGWQGDELHPYDLARRVVAALPDARLETLPALGELFTNPATVGRIYGRFLDGPSNV